MTPAESNVYLLWGERSRYLAMLSEEVPSLVESFIGEVVRGGNDLHEWATAHWMKDAWLVSALEENRRIWRCDRPEGFVQVEAARVRWLAEAEKLRGDPGWAAISGRAEQFRFVMPMRFVADIGPDRFLNITREFQHRFGQPWQEFEKTVREIFEKELAAVKSHFTELGLLPQGRARIRDEDLRLLARYQTNLLRNPPEKERKRIARAAIRLGLERRPRNKQRVKIAGQNKK